MPFAMTHLYIAYNILKTTPHIKKPNNFLLGALAHDSVHFRNNYISDMKFKSHLCVGNENWGAVTNNHEWLEHVLSFLRKNKHTDETDFINGYCCHILADIQNNIKVWMPFRAENIEKFKEGVGSIYRQEANAIDYELYLQPQQKIVWKLLERASASDIHNIAKSSEINEMKNSILYEQFTDRKLIDVSKNKYVTLPKMQEFISMESQYIKDILYKED